MGDFARICKIASEYPPGAKFQAGLAFYVKYIFLQLAFPVLVLLLGRAFMRYLDTRTHIRLLLNYLNFTVINRGHDVNLSV